MKPHAIAAVAAVLFGFAGQALAQNVGVPLDIHTPAAAPSQCAVASLQGGGVRLTSDGKGGVTATSTRLFTFNVSKTLGDLPAQETMTVVYRIDPEAVVAALAPYVDGVSAADIQLTGVPAYPGSDISGTTSADGSTGTWVLPLDVYNLVQIGTNLDPGKLVQNAKLKFLDQPSVDLTIAEAFSVTCRIQRTITE